MFGVGCQTRNPQRRCGQFPQGILVEKPKTPKEYVSSDTRNLKRICWLQFPNPQKTDVGCRAQTPTRKTGGAADNHNRRRWWRKPKPEMVMLAAEPNNLHILHHVILVEQAKTVKGFVDARCRTENTLTGDARLKPKYLKSDLTHNPGNFQTPRKDVGCRTQHPEKRCCLRNREKPRTLKKDVAYGTHNLGRNCCNTEPQTLKRDVGC